MFSLLPSKLSPHNSSNIKNIFEKSHFIIKNRPVSTSETPGTGVTSLHLFLPLTLVSFKKARKREKLSIYLPKAIGKRILFRRTYGQASNVPSLVGFTFAYHLLFAPLLDLENTYTLSLTHDRTYVKVLLFTAPLLLLPPLVPYERSDR